MVQLPALLLLHGVGDSGDCLRPFLSALELPDLVSRTPNAPAHGGRRAAPGLDVNYNDMVQEAQDHAAGMFLEAGPAGLVIGGHSMGAAVALAVAARQPDMIRGLWMEDPPFWDHDDSSAESAAPVDLGELRAWFYRMQQGTLADAISAARADHPAWPADEFEPWARAKLDVDATAFATPKVWIQHGWSRLAAEVECATVVVAGATSRGGLLGAQAASYMASLPHWTVHRLPRAGHDVRRDDRPASTRLLLQFLISLAID